MTVVFAFDRDWTVDVNPHPNRAAVPLSWVRYLAHETDHPVYAIGNQRLAEEAAIPGVVDVVGRHDDDWMAWLGSKRPDGRYERYPTRRERLSLIADLHPDADAYVVVDDLDLSDVDDWSHYHAWDFVPALERGTFDPSLPWVDAEDATRTDGGTGRVTEDSTRTDGGTGRVANGPPSRCDDATALTDAFTTDACTEPRIEPANASALADFLGSHADEPGFELAYRDDGRVSTLVHDVAIIERTIQRPAAAPAVRCVPVDPRADAFTVRVDAIRELAVADPPAGAFTPDDASKRERIRGLRRLATATPASVPTTMATVYLDTAIRREPRRDLLVAICRASAENPAAFASAVPTLRRELAIDDPIAPAATLRALRRIAAASPADVAPAAGVALSFLETESEGARGEAARLASELVDEHAADVEPFLDELAALVRDHGPGLAHATYALTALGREDPLVLASVRDELAALVTDDATSDGVRSNALAALGRLSGEDPGLGVDVVPVAVSLFDADDPKTRNNAIALVSDVAKHHSDVVTDHADVVADLTIVEDEFTRINATCTLARIAEDHPEAVEGCRHRLRARLVDDSAVVRRNACDFFGHAVTSRPTAVVPHLETRAQTDEDAKVRRRARLALDRIDELTLGARSFDDARSFDEEGTFDEEGSFDDDGSR